MEPFGDTSVENLTLLCSHHHTLLHEGRFRIRREADGALRFERADGRVIARFGYRLEDMRDDYVFAEEPSAEVREGAGVYLLSGRSLRGRDHRQRSRRAASANASSRINE